MFKGPYWDAIEEEGEYAVVERELLKLVRPFGVKTVSAVELRAPRNAVPMLGRLFGKRDGSYAIRYRKNRLVEHDVAARMVTQQEDPFGWKAAQERVKSPEEEQVFAIAREHGFTDGFVLPRYGRRGSLGFITFVGDHLDDSPEAQRLFEFTGLRFYRFATHKERKAKQDTPELELTNRQRDVLLWIANGKTDWEISQLLNIAENTVNRHVELAKERLGVRTRAEAIAVAMTYNLIDPL